MELTKEQKIKIFGILNKIHIAPAGTLGHDKPYIPALDIQLFLANLDRILNNLEVIDHYAD